MQLPVIMLGCKADHFVERRIETKLGARLGTVFDVSFKEISSKSNLNAISEVLDELIGMIVNGPETSKYTSLRKRLRKMKSDQSSLDLLSPTFANNRNLKIPHSAKSLQEKSNELPAINTDPFIVSQLYTFPQSDEKQKQSDSKKNVSENIRTSTKYSMLNHSQKTIANSIGEINNFVTDTYSRDIPQDNHKFDHELNLKLRQDEDIGPNSIGFTVEELIERITSPEIFDLEFTQIFIMLFRKFMRPIELIDRLLDRFEEFEFDFYDPEYDYFGNILHPAQLRVCNVLIYWISQYWMDDFQSNEKIRFTLDIFVNILLTRPSFFGIANILLELMNQNQQSKGQLIDWGIPEDAYEENQFLEEEFIGSTSDRPISLSAISTFSEKSENIIFHRVRNLSGTPTTFSQLSRDSPTESSIIVGIASQAAQLVGISNENTRRRPSGGSFFSMLNQRYGSTTERKSTTSSQSTELDNRTSISNSTQTHASWSGLSIKSTGEDSNFGNPGWGTLSTRRSSAVSIESNESGPGASIPDSGSFAHSSNATLINSSMSDNLFFDLEDETIAHQLNLIEFEIYSKIKVTFLIKGHHKDIVSKEAKTKSKDTFEVFVYCKVQSFN
ncbi:Son of sevenless 2 [Nowakowskiella sp. JEL0078]|nr:Son of sevenless 2 [Nowakowskiella sp. JEL0078]